MVINMKVPPCQRNCQSLINGRYFEPLHVDTSLQYTISKSDFLGLGDPRTQHEPVLLIGKKSDFNQDNGHKYCETYPGKQNDDMYTSTELCKSINKINENKDTQEKNAVHFQEVGGTVYYYYNKTSHKQEDANRFHALQSFDKVSDSSMDAPLIPNMTSHNSSPLRTLEGAGSCQWKADEQKHTAHKTLRGGYITRYVSYTRNMWTHGINSGSLNNEFELPSRH